MAGDILEIVGAGASGGITGLFGTLITGTLDFFNRRSERKHQLQMMAHELKVLELEATQENMRLQTEADTKMALADVDALKASYTEAAKRWSDGSSPILVWVDVMRASVRPLLTYMFCIAILVLWWHTGDLDTSQRIVATILYLASASCLWWFGARATSKAMSRALPIGGAGNG